MLVDTLLLKLFSFSSNVAFFFLDWIFVFLHYFWLLMLLLQECDAGSLNFLVVGRHETDILAFDFVVVLVHLLLDIANNFGCNLGRLFIYYFFLLSSGLNFLLVDKFDQFVFFPIRFNFLLIELLVSFHWHQHSHDLGDQQRVVSFSLLHRSGGVVGCSVLCRVIAYPTQVVRQLNVMHV